MLNKFPPYHQVYHLLCFFDLICLTVCIITGSFDIYNATKVKVSSCLKVYLFVLIYFTSFVTWFGLFYIYSSSPPKMIIYIILSIFTNFSCYYSSDLFYFVVKLCVFVHHFGYRAEMSASGYRCLNTLHSIIFDIFPPLLPQCNNHASGNEVKSSDFFLIFR